MNIKRAFFILAAVLLLPVSAFAQNPTSSFEVTVNFNPNSEGAATDLSLVCNGGDASGPITGVADGETVTLVLEFPATADSCQIVASDAAGYQSGVFSSACDTDGTVVNFDGQEGTTFSCDVDFDSAPSAFTVDKVWDIRDNGQDGSAPFDVSSYDITIACYNDIDDCSETCDPETETDCGHLSVVSFQWPRLCNWTFTNERDRQMVAMVDVSTGPANCYAYEDIFDSVVDSDTDDCRELAFEQQPGMGETRECTIVNTVFFEGIPTLSQYGLAIMALLMLGVGFVGFRRFV